MSFPGSPMGPTRTSGGIQTETCGFPGQQTPGCFMKLILIAYMSFLVDFRPKMAS
jgi:hypothetical protein